MKLVSYKDLPKERVMEIISQIPQDFEGWQNYNSDTNAGLPFLLYEQKRFENYDYYFLLDGDIPAACGGFYQYEDIMLIAVRTYTWNAYRFGRLQVKKLLNIQVIKSFFDYQKKEVYITVNSYNQRLYTVFKRRITYELSKETASTIEPFLEFQNNPVIIQGVHQYLAKLTIDQDLKKSVYWNMILTDYHNDLRNK